MGKPAVFLALFFVLPALAAQEAPFFSVAELLKCAGVEKIAWRPDWPPEIPVDAFEVHLFSGLALKSETDGRGLRLRRNGNRTFWDEFPFLLNGDLVQVQSVISGGVLKGFSLQEGIEIELLQFDVEGNPVMCRVDNAGTFYFVLFTWQSAEILETWFNEEGTLACIFELTKHRQTKTIGESDAAEETFFHFDSMNNITKIQTGGEVFTAGYNANGVRYRSGYSERHEIQWDENGLPVRMYITPIADNEQPDVLPEILKPYNVSWEYDFDAKGNWVSRREIVWREYSGVMVSTGGSLWERTIEYARITK
ncbi:hypothetical protein FACS189494_11800 [Spirochaetia bacterium]|nr:hypothetical protein FACS189494_11800 [Spirochaetia bacterium]